MEKRSIEATAGERATEALRRVEGALQGLRFGTITLVVQDGVIVQVDRMEKIRLDKPTA